ncbi:MAG: hypothetical protein ACK4R6_14355 [Spirosomataceae bacterium]
MKNPILRLMIYVLGFSTAYANEPLIYNELQSQSLGLNPVILPNGTKILPQHDGKHYFVDEKNNQQTTGDITPEQVKEIITKAKDAGKKVYNLLSLQYASSLPIVIEKEIAGTTYAIALDKLVFTPAGNTLTIVAMITTPEGNTICFSGEQVGFTGQGGIKEGTLKLLLGNKNALTLFDLEKISLELSGGALKFGCDGFESFSLQGNVIFDRSLIVPDNIFSGEIESGNVTSKFILEDMQDWNNMLIDISIQPFQIPSMSGYGFNVNHAVIDISDYANSTNCVFPVGYTASETNVLWRGVYIGNATVRFPKHFKNRTTQSRLSVGVNHLLIDKTGVSGEIFGENILAIKDGDLSGWDYSLDGASIVLIKSKVKAGSLTGKMRVSISSEEKLLGYKAIIDPTRDYYNFSVKTIDSLDFEIFKAAQVHLEPASTVSLVLENKQFSASAMLHGKMNISSVKGGISLDEFTFQNLFLSTKAPYLSIGFFGGGSDKELQMGNFPISIIAPKILIQDNVANINFGVKVNLDDIGITATGGFIIQGVFVNENNRHFWKNKNVTISELVVTADLDVAKFKGIVHFFDDDPIYGKGFYGEMSMDLDVGINIGARAVAMFGRKEKRYWFVDGELASGGNGNGLSINVLAGSLYKHMAPVAGTTGAKSLSGVVYAPDFSVGWGGRFAIGISTGGSMAGLAGLEILTRSSGGISKIGILGSVVVAGSGWMVTPEAGRIMYSKLCNDSDLMKPGGIANNTDGDNPPEGEAQKFDINAPKGFGANIILKINFDDRSYYGKLGVNASTSSISVQVVGAFYFSPSKWFVHLGEPPMADRIIILLPSLPQIDGYIMLGHGVPELPSPEPNIFTKYPSAINKRSPNINSTQVASGAGIAFGAALSVSSNGSVPKNAPKPILGYTIGARIGLDMMLMKYVSGTYCVGREGQPIGINNWRAAGQVYTIGWLKAMAFGFNVLDIGLGAVLGGAAPNPTYGAGEVAISFKVLVKKFNFNVGFSVGDDCVIVGGDAKVSDEQVFDIFYPAENQELLPKETIPTIKFTNAIESPTQVEGLSGRFRQKVINYRLTDQDGNNIGGSWSVEGTNKIVFKPTSLLPAGKKIIVRVHTQFQKEEDGNWQPFTDGVSSADTQKEYFFMTAKNAEEFKKDIEMHVVNTQTALININQEAVVTANDINVSAAQTGEQILNKANQEVKEIKETILDRGNAMLQNAEKANIPPEKKEEVKQIVNSATNLANTVVDDAFKKVNEIIETAKKDVRNMTNVAVAQVNATVIGAATTISAFETNGKEEITRINNELIQYKRNLEAQRRKEIKWWMGNKKKNEIKNKFRQMAFDADREAQRKMQDVVNRIKAQADAETAAAKQKGKEIMDAALARAKQIMDIAANDAKDVMADARKIADEIMAEAERQSNAIISGAANAQSDLSVFALIAQQESAFYDEADEPTVQVNNSDNDIDEIQIQADLNAEIERKRLENEEENRRNAALQREKQEAEQARQRELQAQYNAEQQRLQAEWVKNDAIRKQVERDEESRKQQAYEAEQRRIQQQQAYEAEQRRIQQQQAYEAEQRRIQQQQAYEAEQRRIQQQQAYEAEQRRIQQQQAYEAEQRRIQQEQQDAYFQYLEQLDRQRQEENERQRRRQQVFQEEQRLNRERQLRDSSSYFPFVDTVIHEW